MSFLWRPWFYAWLVWLNQSLLLSRWSGTRFVRKLLWCKGSTWDSKSSSRSSNLRGSSSFSCRLLSLIQLLFTWISVDQKLPKDICFTFLDLILGVEVIWAGLTSWISTDLEVSMGACQAWDLVDWDQNSAGSYLHARKKSSKNFQ